MEGEMVEKGFVPGPPERQTKTAGAPPQEGGIIQKIKNFLGPNQKPSAQNEALGRIKTEPAGGFDNTKTQEIPKNPQPPTQATNTK